MIKYITKILIGLQTTTIYGCSVYGGYETITHKSHIFANKYDDFYTGIARGSIKGFFLPFNTYKKIVEIYKDE